MRDQLATVSICYNILRRRLSLPALAIDPKTPSPYGPPRFRRIGDFRARHFPCAGMAEFPVPDLIPEMRERLAQSVEQLTFNQ